MALGHLVWITVNACFTLISSLTKHFFLSIPTLCLNATFHCNCWPGVGLGVLKHTTQAVISVCTHWRAGSERWRQVLYRCRWTLRLSVVLSVSLTEVQNLAGSKPNSKATVKLHGWFDCSSLPLLTAVLTDLSKKWISSLASVHQMPRGRFCFRQVCARVCQWCLRIKLRHALIISATGNLMVVI